MFDFTRNAPRWLAAAAVSLLLISCGGSDDTPAPPPFGQTTVVFGASVGDTGNAMQPGRDRTVPAGAALRGPDELERTSVGRNGGGALRNATATPSRLKATTTRYAGATTGTVPGTTVTKRPPSMVVQVDQYLTRVGFQVNPQHLVILDGVTVGNNIADALTRSLAGNPERSDGRPRHKRSRHGVHASTRLYAAGARTSWSSTASTSGLSPPLRLLARRPNNSRPRCRSASGRLAGLQRRSRSQVVPGLRASSPGLNIYYVDLGGSMRRSLRIRRLSASRTSGAVLSVLLGAGGADLRHSRQLHVVGRTASDHGYPPDCGAAHHRGNRAVTGRKLESGAARRRFHLGGARGESAARRS